VSCDHFFRIELPIYVCSKYFELYQGGREGGGRFRTLDARRRNFPKLVWASFRKIHEILHGASAIFRLTGLQVNSIRLKTIRRNFSMQTTMQRYLINPLAISSRRDLETL
jgi:hypothetical protein